MQNEEEIKIENKLNSLKLSTKLFHNINQLILLQIINLLFIFLLLFIIFISRKKEKITLYSNNNKNDDKNIEKIVIDTLPKRIKLLKLLTNNDELEYKGMLECLISENPDSQYCIYHLITPKKVIGKNRVLLGTKSDGCYVLLDDFENVKIAYSFGISKNIQFDKALADMGIDIYMYV